MLTYQVLKQVEKDKQQLPGHVMQHMLDMYVYVYVHGQNWDQ